MKPFNLTKKKKKDGKRRQPMCDCSLVDIMIIVYITEWEESPASRLHMSF